MKPWCNDLEPTLVASLRCSTAAKSAQEIAAELRVDPRKARAIISHLRADHAQPICSTPASGYYWPRSREAVNHTVAQLRSRVLEITATVEGIEAGIEAEFGQQELFGFQRGVN